MFRGMNTLPNQLIQKITAQVSESMHVSFGPRLRGLRTSMGQRPCWLGRPCCGLKHWTTSSYRRRERCFSFGGIVQHLQNSHLQHFVSHDGEIGSLERIPNFLFARLGCHRFWIFFASRSPLHGLIWEKCSIDLPGRGATTESGVDEFAVEGIDLFLAAGRLPWLGKPAANRHDVVSLYAKLTKKTIWIHFWPKTMGSPWKSDANWINLDDFGSISRHFILS